MTNLFLIYCSLIMWTQFLVVIFTAFASYYVAQATIFANKLPCNRGMQSFDLMDQTFYWKVHSGSCNKHDLHFEHLAGELSKMLAEMHPDWKPAECAYSTLNDKKYVFSYGTDFYAVDELDCVKPLRDLEHSATE